MNALTLTLRGTLSWFVVSTFNTNIEANTKYLIHGAEQAEQFHTAWEFKNHKAMVQCMQPRFGANIC